MNTYTSRICRQDRCKKAYVLKGVDKWDDFWKNVFDNDDEKCCCILDLVNAKEEVDLHMRFDVPSGSTRSILLQFPAGLSGDMSLELTLGEGSHIGLFVSGVVGTGEDLAISVISKQDTERSHLLAKNRIVLGGGGSVHLDTLGSIQEGGTGSVCDYDSKILYVGEGGKISGVPKMEIHREDVTAEHGLAAGRVPEDAVLYMKSRGLDENQVEDIYAKGFLEFRT